jgi:heme exporter protein CcmD
MMFDYGRYTPYVLSAYAIAGVVLIGLIVWSIVRLERARKKLAEVEPPEQAKAEKAS